MSESMALAYSTRQEEFRGLNIKPDTKYRITLDIDDVARKMKITVEEFESIVADEAPDAQVVSTKSQTFY